MTWTQTQIDTAVQLAEVMKEKGIEWEWREDDNFLDEGIFGTLCGCEACLKVCMTSAFPKRVPLPSFERCREVLEEWGWVRGMATWDDDEGSLTLQRKSQNISGPSYYFDKIEVTGPDPTTAAILACVEAVRRMK